MIITLYSVAETLLFGQCLSHALSQLCPSPRILLYGDLGAGKTTMSRGFVQSLRGAKQAEVSSPSFNLLNIYPTTPPVAHIDLYRLEHGLLGDDILDILEDEHYFCIVEWAERLEGIQLNIDWLRLYWHIEHSTEAVRSVEIQVKHNNILSMLHSTLKKSPLQGNINLRTEANKDCA